jgi:hypothetical protein
MPSSMMLIVPIAMGGEESQANGSNPCFRRLIGEIRGTATQIEHEGSVLRGSGGAGRGAAARRKFTRFRTTRPVIHSRSGRPPIDFEIEMLEAVAGAPPRCLDSSHFFSCVFTGTEKI